MSVFVDTSALLAVLDRDDENHLEADSVWRGLLASVESLMTSNYVLVETIALAQNRLGLKALQAMTRDILPVLNVRWVDETQHKAGLAAALSRGKRRLSFVDCVSFEIMKDLGLTRCFVFDAHFEEQGFDSLP